MALSVVLTVRRLIDEPQPDMYTDAELQMRLDASAGQYSLARDIWAEKMAAASSLVNISEGGSSRSMSQAYDQAKQQYEFFEGLANSESGNNPSGPVLRRIVRV